MVRLITLLFPVLCVSGLAFSQEDSLKKRIDFILKEKKATVGVAVLFGENELFEMNKDIYPMMSVCKFPLALAVLDYLDKTIYLWIRRFLFENPICIKIHTAL